MSSYSVDAMIYSALASVDLQNQYFNAYNNPKPDDIDNLRGEYKLARHAVLSKRIGYWSFKEITLPIDPNLKPGWYRAPSDLINWSLPKPTCSSVDSGGVKIYELPSSLIRYIFDPEDLTGMPIEIITSIRDFFLLRLISRAVISPVKLEQIRMQAMLSDKNAQEFVAIQNESKQQIRHGW